MNNIRIVRTEEDLRGKPQVVPEIVLIKDIVPYILAHAKTLEPDFECWWEFNDGYETWFPIFTQEAINFENACSDKAIAIIEPRAFYGSYSSDEVHRYKLLWFRGEIKAINFMVGDTTHTRTLWFSKGDKARVISDLMANFPTAVEDSFEELYTEETGESITNSPYLNFIRFEGDLWAINHSPNHGGLVTSDILKDWKCVRPMRVIEFVEMPIKGQEQGDLVTLDYGPCKHNIKHSYDSYKEFILEDGTILTTAEAWYRKKDPKVSGDCFKQIEKVLDLNSESGLETES